MDRDIVREQHRLRTNLREQQRGRYKEESKQKLIRSIEKHIRTTFIGALSEFEREYGQMWGHGLSAGELTDEESAERDKWLAVREAILNSGNKQLRAARAEISHYTVEWDRYKYDADMHFTN